MKPKAVLIICLILISGLCFYSCELLQPEGPSLEEKGDFAKDLMSESVGYTGIDMSKAASRDITPDPPANVTIVLGDWVPDMVEPLDGEYTNTVTITFNEFTFKSESTVSGILTADITLTYDANELTLLSMTFNGTLTVTGEYEGVYVFKNAALTFDFDSLSLTYSGTVTVDGVEYPFSS